MSKLPGTPEAILLLAKLVKDWKPAARAALDPGSYEVEGETLYVSLSGSLRIGEPVPRRESVSYSRLAGLALAKCNAATRAAIAREYHSG